jgi:hypothetical protein
VYTIIRRNRGTKDANKSKRRETVIEVRERRRKKILAGKMRETKL